MFGFISTVLSLAVKVIETGSYITHNGVILKTTPDVKEATNFDFVSYDGKKEFLIYLPKTGLVWDDPTYSHQGKTYLHPKHGHPNQRWEFVFNKKGSFNVQTKDRRLFYDKLTDTFRTIPNSAPMAKYELGFMLFDIDMKYFQKFDYVPLSNIKGEPAITLPDDPPKEKKKKKKKADPKPDPEEDLLEILRINELRYLLKHGRR